MRFVIFVFASALSIAKAEDLGKKASTLYTNNKFDKVISLLKPKLASVQKDEKLINLLARAYERSGNILPAVKIYKFLIRKNFDKNIFKQKETGLKDYLKNIKSEKWNRDRINAQLTKISLGYSVLIKQYLKNKKVSLKFQKDRDYVDSIIYFLNKPKQKKSGTTTRKMIGSRRWFPQSRTDLLERGLFFLRTEFSYSYSDSLWLMGGKRQDYTSVALFGEEGVTAKRRYLTYGVEGYIGLGKGFQAKLRMSYVEAKLKNAAFFRANKNETVKQVNEISVHIEKSMYRYKFFQSSLFMGFIHPGKVSESRPMFLSSNDFSRSIDFGVNNKIRFAKTFFLSSTKINIPVSGNANSQIQFDMKYLRRVVSKWQIGPIVYFHKSLKGINILGSKFNEQFAQKGIYPLSEKKEQIFGLGLTTTYQLGKKYMLDFSFSKVMDGKNTGAEHSFNLGLGRSFF
jgi:hypothetical protein